MTKRLVLFVEGDGDVLAVPNLVTRLINDLGLHDTIYVDTKPFKVGEFPKLAKDDFARWKRYLGAARKRRDLAGVLLLIDGDAKRLHFEDCPFCAAKAAIRLAEDSKEIGAGTHFSVGVVFANQEYESWLISACETFAKRPSQDRVRALKEDARVPTSNLEDAPRDAKEWLRKNMVRGYKPTVDQLPLTQMIDLEALRSRGIRSFARLERAIHEIGIAVRNESPIVSPARSSD